MQVQSAIQRSQTKAVVRLGIKPLSNGVEPVWTNIGKSDALKARGWRHLTIIPITHDPQKDKEVLEGQDFFTRPDDSEMAPEGTTIVQGNSMEQAVAIISIEQAGDAADGNSMIVLYGYFEYSDIFDAFVTVRYCAKIDIRRNGPRFAFNENGILPLPCNKRSEEQKSETD
jgi:hypothetical protein